MIFTIVGCRPNFIKVDPNLNQVIVHTGQHFSDNMSKAFFKELKIPKPKYNLGLTDAKEMVVKLSALFKKEKPSMVLIIGDTNSSFAGAVAAAECKIPVAHIEAGMRSGKYTMPEEVNRIVIDHIAKICFCPNNEAALNLFKEGKKEGVYVVGDAEFDAMGKLLPLARGKNYKKYILLTIHRDFNDNKETLAKVFKALENERVIFPCHPRTLKTIKKNKIKLPKHLKLLPPQSYKKTLQLISDAKKVITDSGGVQKEAYWMSVPVIILRNETEWKEIVESGSGILVGNDVVKLAEAIKNFKGKLVQPPQGGANNKIKEIPYHYA